MTVGYRRAVAADVAAIHALLQQMAAEAGRSIAGSDTALRKYGFGPEPRFRAVLAEREGQSIGLALVFPEYSSWRGALGLYVQDLYVQPAARGQGVASALIGAALACCEDWDPSYVTLMVDQDNITAQGWYARQGFALRERGDLLILDGAALARFARKVSA
ncbi:MAG: GNAT family N-acetyltransferase [Yoonia sp.]|uniref:GNAT family N-acetyltransferase n=1 Tax=Yoonia sp. TaxID=2212373 RepID=UPI00273D7F2D|nr:GNAT family N-acetyltransferase [Yoonia sp.]MDP5084742.1 GNAT family N-acetyltransferase [Yoonia sp.]